MARAKTSWSQNLGCSIYAKLGDVSAFWFSPDMELLFAAEGILYRAQNNVYSAAFGNEKIEHFRRKYRLAAAINDAFTDSCQASVCECLQGFDPSVFTLPAFRERIMRVDKDALPGTLLDLPIKTIDDAESKGVFNNYLGAAAFLEHTREYVGEIFSLAEELRTDAFFAVLDKYEERVGEALRKTEQGLKESTPLEYSDKLLRKTMRRRGPYSFFTFAPTVFARYRAVRYISKEQFLFFTLRDAVYDNERMLEQIKALADNTRFKILTLLKERGQAQGSDIADEMYLTAPTISHHMKILREAGMVIEQADGNTKFYSLPADVADSLIEALKKNFK